MCQASAGPALGLGRQSVGRGEDADPAVGLGGVSMGSPSTSSMAACSWLSRLGSP